jgi:hypothetical protein
MGCYLVAFGSALVIGMSSAGNQSRTAQHTGLLIMLGLFAVTLACLAMDRSAGRRIRKLTNSGSAQLAIVEVTADRNRDRRHITGLRR